MACLICNAKNGQQKVLEYGYSDMYERYMGIVGVERAWWKCTNCGHFNQTRNYDLKQLEKIYQNGYREVDFRGKTIDQVYQDLMALPWYESENKQRTEWFVSRTLTDTTLDIGSGIGVFPSQLKSYGYDVECVEENKTSQDFINQLGIQCFDSIPYHKKYCNVSLVHVLEHIEKPDEFLSRIKEVCNRHFFVEVPDAREFEMLPKEHDEFNSCHLWFFTLQSLVTLIERNGFTVVEAVRKFYPKRGLSRILALAVI